MSEDLFRQALDAATQSLELQPRRTEMGLYECIRRKQWRVFRMLTTLHLLLAESTRLFWRSVLGGLCQNKELG